MTDRFIFYECLLCPFNCGVFEPFCDLAEKPCKEVEKCPYKDYFEDVE